MKMKVLTALAGLILIGFGFSLQPIDSSHTNHKIVKSSKVNSVNRPPSSNIVKIKKNVRKFFSYTEKTLIEKIYRISRNWTRINEDTAYDLYSISIS